MSVVFKIYKSLDYFDLDIEYSLGNELLVIEGESGAGKTTILNCLAGVRTPDRGMIAVDGRKLFDSSERINVPAEKRNVGYLFQNYALFPTMSVKTNILYGIKNQKDYWTRGKRKELLDYADYMMDILGISHLADKKPGAISGGEKQRAALARAMVTKPSLLLLDEPFSALDENTKSRVYDEFQSFKETLRIPTVFITHNHKESELFADKHIFIKEGRIIEK